MQEGGGVGGGVGGAVGDGVGVGEGVPPNVTVTEASVAETALTVIVTPEIESV